MFAVFNFKIKGKCAARERAHHCSKHLMKNHEQSHYHSSKQQTSPTTALLKASTPAQMIINVLCQTQNPQADL